MLDFYKDNPNRNYLVADKLRHSRTIWFLWFAAFVAFSAVVGLAMLTSGPTVSIIAWLVFLAGCGAILYQPRNGFYLILFFGMVGDNTLSPWFPFVKNFSSRESILFLHDALIISPLEAYIVLMFISWAWYGFARNKLPLFKGDLFWPANAFLVFLIIGLFYGISTGGNVTIALWESRPLFYLVAFTILGSNLLTERKHINNLMAAALLGLFIEALTGNYYFFVTLKGSLNGVEAITDHSAAVHMNLVFVLAVTMFMYKCPTRWRIGVSLIVPFTVITYMATQRRAAMVALFAAFMLLAIVLLIENRKAFFLIVPPLLILSVLYLGIYWNSTGALGLPARAVKALVTVNQASARDQASNAYRELEDMNTNFTVRQKPITGIGFGNKFYVVIPMPDISFFTWWQYFPHNSIIWIWLKTGIFGFFTMVYLVGSAIMLGGEAFYSMPRNELRAFALAATLYIVMHLIFANVDIAWDIKSMILMGIIFGMLNSLKKIAAQPVDLPQKRWPWQPDPQPAPVMILTPEQ